MYYTRNNIKSSYNNNKFKISTPTWNEELTLPDGSYSVSDIQEYFQYILQNGENVAHLEITEVVLVHCNMLSNDYQHDSRVLYTFVPNKSFGSLLDISPSNHIFLKTLNSEYDEIVVWFTDQSSKPLEIEDRINLTMVIK